jgi:hypothetical protein
MLPWVFLYGCNSFIPFDIIVNTIMDLVPFRVANAYQALVFAMFVVTLPFGLQLVLKGYPPRNNVDPRKQKANLAATNPLFGRLNVRSNNFSI